MPRGGKNSRLNTLALLRAQAKRECLDKEFLTCKDILYFISKKQRANVVDYIFDVASDFHIRCDTAVRAIQLFDRFAFQWTREANERWSQAENALARYKNATRIVLAHALNIDCANHVLSFLNRKETTPLEIVEHFARMRDLAEETCMVCLSLASKFSDSKYVGYNNFRQTLGNRVTVDYLKEHELKVLDKIGWKLNILSAYNFEDLLRRQIGYTPDDYYSSVIDSTLCVISPLYELQHKSVCVIAAVAMLSAFKRQGPEAFYAHQLERLARACELRGRKVVELEEDVKMAVRVIELGL